MLQRKRELTWLLFLLAAFRKVLAARVVAVGPMVVELLVLLEPRRSEISSASSARGSPKPLLLVRFERASRMTSGCDSK